ncbi:MAG TPA: hypothetical protein VFH73_27045 [Polyangia bacterium]|jgi:hypothetical protein|nr:hypothetical protein [Polyangia bacterium]
MTLSPRTDLTRIAVVALAMLLMAGAAACDRTNLGANHGRAYRQLFARQAVDPLAGEKPRSARVFQGLDSQEASIVARTYRKGLAPKEAAEGQQAPMLMMAPRAGVRDTGNMPPPSVPDR